MARSAVLAFVVGCSGGGAITTDGGLDALVSDGPANVDASDAGSGGQVIVADNSNGAPLLVFDAPLTSSSQPAFTVSVNESDAVRTDRNGKLLWAADIRDRRIVTFDLPLTPASTPKTIVTTSGSPLDFRLDSRGNLFVAELNVGIEWWASPPAGAPSGSLASGTVQALAIDATDTLYAAPATGASFLVYTSPTTQSTPTSITTQRGAYTGLEIAQGRLFASSRVDSHLDSYVLPLVASETSTIVLPSTSAWRLSLGPAGELVVPTLGESILFLAPPNFTLTTLTVPLSPHVPYAVAFYTP